MSFFKPYRLPIEIKSGTINNIPPLYRITISLLLAGCPPAEPVSSWADRLNIKKNFVLIKLLTTTGGKNNRGIRTALNLLQLKKIALFSLQPYTFYFLGNEIELQRPLLEITEDVTADRRLIRLW